MNSTTTTLAPLPSLPPFSSTPRPPSLPAWSARFSSVFSHGFINGPDGRKMSKSLGNVVDPHDMISRYPVDSFRFYLTRETTYGGDLNFNEASLRAVHNNELADVLVRKHTHCRTLPLAHVWSI